MCTSSTKIPLPYSGNCNRSNSNVRSTNVYLGIESWYENAVLLSPNHNGESIASVNKAPRTYDNNIASRPPLHPAVSQQQGF